MFDTMVATKVVGAFCGTLLVFLLGKWAAEEIYHPGGEDLEAAYVIETDEGDAGGEEVAEVTFMDLFLAADAGAGQALWAQCRACHSLEDGNNMLGPHLFNVVGRPIESIQGFNYSGALPEGEWDPETLSNFIASPRNFAPGTSMGYPGMPDMQNRANLIAFLVQNSPDYEMPASDAPAPEAPEAPAPEAPEAPETPAPEQPEAPDQPAAGGSEMEAAFAQADAAAGQQIWRRCMACHVADAETNRMGPHLVDIVNRPIGAVDGYRYSGSLPEGEWSLDNLSTFLHDPEAFAPGTTMAFPGLENVQDRANVIAFIEAQTP